MDEDFPGCLSSGEKFWRDLYFWLDGEGYTLRPRYKPGWSPTWKNGSQSHYAYEDGQKIRRDQVIDAVRKSDGEMVALKRIRKARHPREVEIGMYLSSPPLSEDPRNHCCPIYATLHPPEDDNVVIIVMPFLRVHDDPFYTTVGEAIEFFRQVFEGVQFIHMHHVAHRDCQSPNIMMDPHNMYPKLYHPVDIYTARNFKRYASYYTRTRRPTRYYITDFGLSVRYGREEKNPLEPVIYGGDRTVPEFKVYPTVPVNPFKTDIYCLGNMIKMDFMDRFTNCDFMKPLVDDMVAEDPASRPNMDEVVARFADIQASFSPWQLRARLVLRRDAGKGLVTFLKRVQHVYRLATYLLLRRSPLPNPGPKKL